MWQNACNRVYICPLRCHIFLRYRLIGYYPMERKRTVYKKCKCLYTFHGLYTHHGSCLVGTPVMECPPRRDVTVMLYIRRTRYSRWYGLFQCDALPSISCPCIVGKVGSKAFNISLILIKDKVTSVNFVS